MLLRGSEDPASQGEPGQEFRGGPQLHVDCRPMAVARPSPWAPRVVGRCVLQTSPALLCPSCAVAEEEETKKSAEFSYARGVSASRLMGPPAGDPEPLPLTRTLGSACASPHTVLP